MKLVKLAAVALALVLPSLAGAANADYIAYDVTSGLLGNQAFTGTVGMDFDVNDTIVITKLGVFDSGGDGLTTSKIVSLYDRDTQALLFQTTIAAGTGATLVNGSRFVDIAAQVFTAGRHLTIVAEGFSGNDPNYNTFNTNPAPSALDTGLGAITFVGSGRYGSPGNYPGTVDARTVVNPYAAGTFAFVPEPNSTILLGMGVFGLFGYTTRRRMLTAKTDAVEA